MQEKGVPIFWSKLQHSLYIMEINFYFWYSKWQHFEVPWKLFGLSSGPFLYTSWITNHEETSWVPLAGSHLTEDTAARTEIQDCPLLLLLWTAGNTHSVKSPFPEIKEEGRKGKKEVQVKETPISPVFWEMCSSAEGFQRTTRDVKMARASECSGTYMMNILARLCMYSKHFFII